MALTTVKDAQQNTLVSDSASARIDLPENVPTRVEIDLQGATVASSSRVGDDLILELSNGKRIVVEDFFANLPGATKHELFFETDEGFVQASFGEAASAASDSSAANSAGSTTGAGAGGGALSLILGGVGLLGLAGAAGGGGGGGGIPAAEEPTPAPTITLATTTSLSGTGIPGATVSIDLGDGSEPLTAIVDEGGNWNIEAEAPLEFEDGDDVTLIQTPEEGEASLPEVVAIDLTPPDAPVINPTDGDVISGTGEPGATVTVTIDGIEEPLTAIVDEDGNWSVDPVEDLAHATAITATQTDAMGNESEVGEAETDSEPPLPPEIDPTNGDLIEGSAEPFATVELTIPGQDTVTVEADEDGNWAYTPETVLEDGVVVSATQTDLAGNTGEAAEETIDGIPPVAPTVDLSDGNSVSGLAEPGATVFVSYEGLEEPLEVAADPETGEWEIPVSPELLHETVLSVTAVDAAGNVSEPTESTVDAEHPDAPVINPTQGDVITGTGEPGATLSLQIEGFEEPFITEVGEDGTWSVDPDPETTDVLPHDTGLVANLTDAAGNVSDNTESATDSEPPLAPVIDPTDGTEITGTGEAGATLTLQIEGVGSVEVLVDEEGNWSYTPEEQLPHETGLIGTQTDAAGNTSDESVAATDSVAPDAPDFNPASDVSISGQGEPGATVSVTFEGLDEPMTALVNEDGEWEIAPEDIAEGIEDGTVLIGTQTDPAGNESTFSTEVVDAIHPVIPTIEPTDGTEITGTGEPGTVLTLTFGDPEETMTTEVGEDGNWTITPEEQLPHDTELTAVSTDDAGNESDPANETTDSDAPDAPVINPTNGTEITGTGEAGATVTLDIEGYDEPVEVLVDEDGEWSFTPEEALADEIGILATQTDVAGNTSLSDTEVVDADAPDAPTIDPTNGASLSGTGEPGATINVTYVGLAEPLTAEVDEDGNWEIEGLDLADGTVLFATQLDDAGNESGPVTETVDGEAPEAPAFEASANTATGTGEPGATVEVRDPDDEVIGTAVVDEDGNWTAELEPESEDGDVLTATQTDAAGNESDEADATVDDDAPDAPEFTTSAARAVGDGGDEPGATINVFAPDGETVIGTAIVDEDGDWAADLDPAFADGNELSATATDAVGNESDPATATIDDVAPDAPVFVATSTSATGTVDIDDEDVPFELTVNLYAADGTILLGTAEVDEDGNWQIDIDPALADGVELTATTTDAVGNVSGPGEATVDAIAPVVTIDPLVTGAETVLSGTGEPNTEIELFDSEDNSLGTTTTDDDGNWTLTPPAPLEDDAEVSASQTDAAGNTGTAEQTVALDFDDDGVRNTVDIDDDGDGILDTNEDTVFVNALEPDGGAFTGTLGNVFTTRIDSTNATNGRFLLGSNGRLDGGGATQAGTADFALDTDGIIAGRNLTYSLDVGLLGNGNVLAEFTVELVVDGEVVGELTGDAPGPNSWSQYSFGAALTQEQIDGGVSILITVPEILGAPQRRTVLFDNIQFGIVTSDDADGDGAVNSLDVDSDGSGISDNVEAQYGQTYVAPTGNDADGDGLDDAYDQADGIDGSIGIIPANTTAGLADFVDDEGTGVDTLPAPVITSALTSGIEGTGIPGAEIMLSGTGAPTDPIIVGEDGTWSADFDPALEESTDITATQTVDHLEGESGTATAELEADTDSDGVGDSVDIDDDGDGILDVNEVSFGEIGDFENLTTGASLRFDDDNGEFSGTLVDNNIPDEVVSGAAIEFGAFFAENGSIGIEGVNNTPPGFGGQFRFEEPAADATLQDAVDNGAYVDLTFTTSDDPSRALGLAGISAPDGGFSGKVGIFVNGELVLDDVSNIAAIDPTTAPLLNNAENTVRIAFYDDVDDIRFFIDHFDLTLASAEFEINDDADDDGTINALVTDSDGGGVGDNVEAQYGQDYVAPSGVDADGDGLDDAYDDNLDGAEDSVGLTPNDAVYDYDPDAGELPLTIDEALTSGLSGTGLPGATITVSTAADGDLGTATVDEDGNWSFDIAEADPVTVDADEEITATQTHPDFAGAEGVATAAAVLDTDFDGVIDTIDIDDDNDGILDVNESATLFTNEFGGTFGTLNGTETVRDLQNPVDGYTFTASNNAAGQYAVVDAQGADNFHGFLFGHLEDASGDPDGAFLVINGGTTQGAFFSEQIVLTTDTEYDFGFSAANGYDGGGNPFEIGMRIFDADGILLQDFTPGELVSADWVESSSSFNTGSETEFTIELYNISTNASGNDFAVDNIFVRQSGAVVSNDVDNDGIINALDTDSDNGGIDDNVEVQYGQDYIAPLFDEDGNPVDVDGDGLNDAYDDNLEGAENSVGLTPADTDGDGIGDYVQGDLGSDTLPVTINPGAVGAETVVSGTGVVGATITLTDDDENQIGDPVIVGEDGTWSITPETPIAAGTELTATLSDADHLPGETATATQTVDLDTDGDGVLNAVDIDDDNDGILDVDETGEDEFHWFVNDAPVDNAITGSVGGVGYTYTSSEDINVTNDLPFPSRFPEEFIPPSGNIIQNTLATQNTIVFDAPVTNPTILFDSIGSGGQRVTVDIGQDFEIIHNGLSSPASAVVVDNGDGTISSNGGSAVLVLPGTHTEISFDYLQAEFFASFAIGFAQPGDLDTDDDSIVDRLDLDSDDGGASDTIEAQHGETLIDVPRDEDGNIIDFVDADGDGLHDAYDEDEADASVAASVGLGLTDADNNGTADFLETDNDSDIDTDGDGVYNHIDIDDDNDGILDVDETQQIVTLDLAENSTTPSFGFHQNDTSAYGSADNGPISEENIGAKYRLDLNAGSAGTGVPDLDTDYFSPDLIDGALGAGVTEDSQLYFDVGAFSFNTVGNAHLDPFANDHYVQVAWQMQDEFPDPSQGLAMNAVNLTQQNGDPGPTTIRFSNDNFETYTEVLTETQLQVGTGNVDYFDEAVVLQPGETYQVRFYFHGNITANIHYNDLTFGTQSFDLAEYGLDGAAGGDIDSDDDGIVDRLDTDSDGDGIDDIVENGGVDADGDGMLDSLSEVDGTSLDGYEVIHQQTFATTEIVLPFTPPSGWYAVSTVNEAGSYGPIKLTTDQRLDEPGELVTVSFIAQSGSHAGDMGKTVTLTLTNETTGQVVTGEWEVPASGNAIFELSDPLVYDDGQTLNFSFSSDLPLTTLNMQGGYGPSEGTDNGFKFDNHPATVHVPHLQLEGVADSFAIQTYSNGGDEILVQSPIDDPSDASVIGAIPGGYVEIGAPQDTDGDGAGDFVDTVFDLTAATGTALETGVIADDGSHSEIAFDGTGLLLDLTSLDNDVFTNVETVDLSGSGANSLTLNIFDLVDLSADTDALYINGDADDTVVADNVASGTFASGGSASVDGVTYDIYTSGGATLLIEEDVNVTLI